MNTEDILEFIKQKLDYDRDTGKFYWKSSGKEAGYITKGGYRAIKVLGKEFKAHQLVYLLEHGYIPKVIDHINHQKDDNRIDNLREVTIGENNKNLSMPSSNTSGIVGVSYNEKAKKWDAKINVDGKQKHLGYYETKEDAAQARAFYEEKFGFHKNHGAPKTETDPSAYKEKKAEEIQESIEAYEREVSEEALAKELSSAPVVITEPTEDDLTLIEYTPEKPLTVTERYICELYSLGHSPKRIASELGMPVSAIRRTLAKPHIASFVKELVNAQYAVMKEGRLRILNKIIEDKLEKLEEEFGDDLSGATKKDIVDLLVIVDNLQKEKEKAELGTVGDTYVNVINQIIKD
jgi:hypothetical protein